MLLTMCIALGAVIAAVTGLNVAHPDSDAGLVVMVWLLAFVLLYGPERRRERSA